VRGERLEIGLEIGSSNQVENDVDAGIGSQFAHAFDKLLQRIAHRDGLIEPQRAHLLEFVSSERRGVDHGPRGMGQLHRRSADAQCRGVDQAPLAHLHACAGSQGSQAAEDNSLPVA
jgi:hypothetical protein